MNRATNWRAAPILGVRDVRESAAYFRTTLGFSCGPDDVFSGGKEAVYAIACRDGVAVHLQIRRGSTGTEDQEDHEGAIYIYVPDVDALHSELRDAGATIFRPLQDEPYAVRDFTIETPDGHRITFGTPLDT